MMLLQVLFDECKSLSTLVLISSPALFSFVAVLTVSYSISLRLISCVCLLTVVAFIIATQLAWRCGTSRLSCLQSCLRGMGSFEGV